MKNISTFSLFAIILGMFGIFQSTSAQGVQLQIPLLGKTEVSGIAEYVIIISQWIVGALSMLAVLLIMIGGLAWLTARSDQKWAARAKKLTTDSILGLIIALGSYILLATISQSFVNLNDLNIEGIEGIAFEEGTFPVATQSIEPSSDGVSGGNGTVQSGQPIKVTCDQNLFTKYGFQQPTNAKTFNQERWKIASPYFAKVSQLLDIDFPFIAMWPFLENGANNYADNCGDKEFDADTLCAKWDPCSGSAWQVGYGIWPDCEGVKWAKEAFQKMYGDASNTKVQQIGQSVISKSSGKGARNGRISGSFPNMSIDDIVTKSKNGDLTARKNLATILKDPAIGAYLVGKHFKNEWNIQRFGGRTAESMHKWTWNKEKQSYGSNYYDPQKVGQYIAGACMMAKSAK